jgi:hypothetical protein
MILLDAELEASWAPLDKVERGLCLQRSNSSCAVAGNDVATVQQCDSHVLAIAWVADHHLVVRLEALEGQIVDLEALVRALVARDHRCVAD